MSFFVTVHCIQFTEILKLNRPSQQAGDRFKFGFSNINEKKPQGKFTSNCFVLRHFYNFRVYHLK